METMIWTYKLLKVHKPLALKCPDFQNRKGGGVFTLSQPEARHGSKMTEQLMGTLQQILSPTLRKAACTSRHAGE